MIDFKILQDLDYGPSDECRKECAERIINQTTDLSIDRVYTKYDSKKEKWTDEWNLFQSKRSND